MTLEDHLEAKRLSEEEKKEEREIYKEQYEKSTFMKAHKDEQGNKRKLKKLKARMGRNIMDEMRLAAQLRQLDPNAKPKTKLELLDEQLEREKAFAEEFGLNSPDRPVDTSSDEEGEKEEKKVTGIIKKTQQLLEGNAIDDDIAALEMGRKLSTGET